MQPEEEYCPYCGKVLKIKTVEEIDMVFLVCSDVRKCAFVMPILKEMPGKCFRCGGRLIKCASLSRRSNKWFTYYCCEHYNSKVAGKECAMVTFDLPVKENCPACGKTMFKKAESEIHRPFCINEECCNFTPEEKRE